jgi:flagellar assembly protein FliH
MRQLSDVLSRVEGPPVPEWLTKKEAPTARPMFALAAAPDKPDPSVLEQHLEDARTAAELDGLKAAQEKVETLCERYLDGIGHLAEVAKEARRPLADEVVALAVVIAREILQRELSVDRDRVLETVERVLSQVKGDGGVSVRLGRADLAYVTQRRPDLFEAGVRFVEDESIGVGGCVVETLGTVTDATLEKRLATVARAVSQLFAEEPAEGRVVC